MTFEVRRAIRADHPCLSGHFPGQPLVPGVLILDEVLAVLRARHKDCQLSAIPAVKFLRPLEPEQPFTIRLAASTDDPDKINFCCRIEDRVIAEGKLEVYRGTKVTS